jgi:hypothetical protein
LGAEIEIIDGENADIILPLDSKKSEKALVLLLTCGVYATDASYNIAKRRLSLTWS